MSYGLGIDLGTSCTVAAISQIHEVGAGVESEPLGTPVLAVSSVLHLDEDGSLLVGDAAEHRVLTEPDRVLRGFVRRVGETAPLDGQWRPEVLTARLFRWMVDMVAEGEGAQPDRVGLAHPPDWGLAERQLVDDALLEFGINDVTFVPAPVAAVTGWTAEGGLELPGIVAVHDLGGVVDATVLARTKAGGFEQLGTPRTLDHAGGAALDEIVFAHVLDVLGDRVAAADLDDLAMLEGMARLVADCVVAREALSDSAAIAIPVTLPGVDTSVELTRPELETMIRPALLDGVDALRGAVADAGLTVPELDVVLVTGGVAGTPLVARLLADELGRPVRLPADPLRAAAIGAAVAASGQWEDRAPSSAAPLSLDTAVVPEPIAAQLTDPPGSFSPLAAGPVGHPAQQPPRQRALLAAAAGVLAVAATVIPLTIIQGETNSSAPPVVKAEDGGASEKVPRGTPDHPSAANFGTATSGETRTGTVGGAGEDARGKPRAVPTSVPAPAAARRAAPRPVVPVNPGSAPVLRGPESPPPPPRVPSNTAQPPTTISSPPSSTLTSLPTTTPPTTPPVPTTSPSESAPPSDRHCSIRPSARCPTPPSP
ncbi:MAG: Hsp70 family protein [Actinomycetota bacterium]|nr:Hsp70 family protein [Actinomycetota bacterium]